MNNKEQLHEAELILETVLDKEASREYLKGLVTTYFNLKKDYENRKRNKAKNYRL